MRAVAANNAGDIAIDALTRDPVCGMVADPSTAKFQADEGGSGPRAGFDTYLVAEVAEV